ncbi:MAG: aconitate hydratase AcnA [Pseudonocardiaceae bacterium]
MSYAADSFGTRGTMSVGTTRYEVFRLAELDRRLGTQWRALPFSLKVLLENLLRGESGAVGAHVTAEHIEALIRWDAQAQPSTEIQFTPARVIMQDFTGVPCLVDLATMREAVTALGGDPQAVNPLAPAELVIDHSVIAEVFGRSDALERNVDLEYQRNRERYQFLRWGQGAFNELKVVPPGTGIVHQVNIEHLARTVMTRNGQAYPDTVVGTDSHTTMVNGLGVLGWGVGGIEAEAAMLGQPVSMLIPQVVGCKLTGSIPPGATATDVVLTLTELFRRHGVVGKFIEFYGAGVAAVPLANRATIGNMSPEFGSTCAIFPIDEETIRYLTLTGRPAAQLALVEAYAKEQDLWHDLHREATYSEYLELDLSTVVPSIAGPKRPQDRIALSDAKAAFRQALAQDRPSSPTPVRPTEGAGYEIDHGAVVIASITSCTNTSNPSVMIGAALLARNAVDRGLTVKPWVKTSMAPGSQVVSDYYDKAGLWPSLEKLGYHLVGYGCTTCIGNSGPLSDGVSQAVHDAHLAVVGVLSGNRNFEGRINPDVSMNYLASPPLVIAYALAGTMDVDFATDPLGIDRDGKPVYLADIWPAPEDIQEVIEFAISQEMFTKDYADVFAGDTRWQSLPTPEGETFGWDPESTYIRKPPYFDGMTAQPAPVADISGARVLVLVGDSVTTDHISPAGAIKTDSPAGRYLAERGVERKDFNSYGSRRGNHEVMIRGTFANIRLSNLLVKDISGGYTRDFTASPDADPVHIYDAAQRYAEAGIPLLVLGGKEYGSGSSRDWAAKGTLLLGVRAVIVESFERIHRSNLIGMGVLPLQFPAGESASSLGLDGTEAFDISGVTALNNGSIPATVHVTATRTGSDPVEFDAVLRIDTDGEAEYYRHGGILQYVLRAMARRAS